MGHRCGCASKTSWASKWSSGSRRSASSLTSTRQARARVEATKTPNSSAMSLRSDALSGAALVSLDRPGCKVTRQVFRRRVRMVWRFAERGELEARFQLCANLLRERVTELHGHVEAEDPLALLDGDAREVGVRQRMAHHKLPDVELGCIEDVDIRVYEASEERPSRAEDPCALAPHRPQFRHEQVRDGMEHKVERGVWKYREVAHV